MINKLDQPRLAKLDFGNYRIGKVLQAWELVGDGPDDTNPVWGGKALTGKSTDLELERTSITVIEYQLK